MYNGMYVKGVEKRRKYIFFINRVSGSSQLGKVPNSLSEALLLTYSMFSHGDTQNGV